MTREEDVQKIILDTLHLHGYHADYACVSDIQEKVEARLNPVIVEDYDSWDDSWDREARFRTNRSSWE